MAVKAKKRGKQKPVAAAVKPAATKPAAREPVKNLLAQVRAANQTDRATAGEQYKALLLQIDNPDPGDAEKLRAVMQTLGRGLDDLEADAALVGEVVQVEAVRAGAADRQAAYEAAAEKLRAAIRARDEAVKVVQEKHKKLIDTASAEKSAAHGACSVVAATEQQLGGAADRWAALVAGESVVAIRRSRRRPTPEPEPARTRAEIIVEARDEYRELLKQNYKPGENEIGFIQIRLDLAGNTRRITAEEIATFGLKDTPRGARGDYLSPDSNIGPPAENQVTGFGEMSLHPGGNKSPDQAAGRQVCKGGGGGSAGTVAETPSDSDYRDDVGDQGEIGDVTKPNKRKRELAAI